MPQSVASALLDIPDTDYDGQRVTEHWRRPDKHPAPVDAETAEQLIGSMVPAIGLMSTLGNQVELDKVPGRTVIFGYPLTAAPGQQLPNGWAQVAETHGCALPAGAVRDAHAEFGARGATVFWLSTQSPETQRETAQTLQLPQPMLSDANLALTRAWELPTFSVEGLVLLRGITIFLRDGVVDGVIYPVSTPDRSVAAALSWLRARSESMQSGSPPTWPSGPEIIPRWGLPHPIPRPRALSEPVRTSGADTSPRNVRCAGRRRA